MQKSSGLVSRSQIRDPITTISERLAVTMLLIGGVQIADKPINKSRVPRHRLGGDAASGRVFAARVCAERAEGEKTKRGGVPG